MTFGIEGTTATVVSLALDAAALRQQAISANIANVNTPGYQPVRVRFEEHLKSLDAASLEGVRPTVEPDPLAGDGTNGPAVALDQEVARLSANTLHYQVLLRALNRQFSILGAAINEGKR